MDATVQVGSSEAIATSSLYVVCCADSEAAQQAYESVARASG